MLFSKLKELVFNRAQGLCEYCKSPANISSQPFVIEHIIPKSKDGTSTEDNLALSCQGCNNYKYNKTEGTDNVTGETVELFNPRKQQWDDNFKWSDNTEEILGLTSSGRVTVEELKLNRTELRNLRALLSSVGKHPPA